MLPTLWLKRHLPSRLWCISVFWIVISTYNRWGAAGVHLHCSVYPHQFGPLSLGAPLLVCLEREWWWPLTPDLVSWTPWCNMSFLLALVAVYCWKHPFHFPTLPCLPSLPAVFRKIIRSSVLIALQFIPLLGWWRWVHRYTREDPALPDGSSNRLINLHLFSHKGSSSGENLLQCHIIHPWSLPYNTEY